MRIAIIGGGVIGLTVANVLGEAGHAVTIYSPQPICELTSNVAAAYWGPAWIGEYDHQLAIETLAKFQDLTNRGEVIGLSEIPFEVWVTEEGSASLDCELNEKFWWRNLAGINFKRESNVEPWSLRMNDQVVRFVERLRFRTIVACMPDYLNWLHERAIAKCHAQIETTWIDDLNELANDFDCVINCTGWGAKSLIKDDVETQQMKLLAGHVVIVDGPQIQQGMLFYGEPFRASPVYFVPRSGSTCDVLCGGTAIEVDEELDPRVAIRFQLSEQTDKLLQRAKLIRNDLSNAREFDRGVGIRPVRKSVRIEYDTNSSKIIHCYGHGGSGMTLSWGSAYRVAELIKKIA
jgi:D-amino-acid oxidase